MNRIDIKSFLLAALLSISFAVVDASNLILVCCSTPISHTTISPFIMPPSQKKIYQQRSDDAARKRYLCGHGTYTGTHIDSHSRHTNHCSRSVLSKYYSRPSWISDEEDSSDTETCTEISSTVLFKLYIRIYIMK